MKTKSNVWAKIREYALPGLITMVGMLLVLILRGIWPFGSSRIDYFDNMQQVAPLYTHLWDFLHGQASLSFDWYTGLGTNVSMSISAFSMLSPFNLFLYLVPRSLILESISLLTIIKMMTMAIGMYAYVKFKNKETSYYLNVIFSLMYAFGGYVLAYGSCFTPWMDIVAIFPFLMIAYEYMLKSKRKLPYILVLGLMFVINYYLSAMALIYIFLMSGIYILVLSEKEERKEHAWNLGIGTIAGIGLSSFVLVPVFMQLSTSQRGGSSDGLLARYIGWIKSAIITDGPMAGFQRWIMIYGMTLAIAIIYAGIKKTREDKQRSRSAMARCLIVFIPVVVEGTNLMLHFGSYNGYTLRNGFLIAFTLISVAAEYAPEVIEAGSIKGFKDFLEVKKHCLRALALIVAFTVFYSLMPSNAQAGWFNEIAAILFYMAVAIVMLFLHYNSISCKAKPAVRVCYITVELFLLTFAMIGQPKFYEVEDYQIGDYVETANAVKNDLEIEESATERIINPDISLNANYPLILRRGALSSFTAALEGNTQYYAKKLGYSKYFLWLLDSGGTVFSDSLLGVSQAVNVNALDPNLYSLVKEAGDYKLYDAKYTLPFALNVQGNLAYADFNKDWISNQNTLYKAISHDDEDLVTAVVNSKKESGSIREYQTKIEGRKALYINIVDKNVRDADANASWLISSMHIYVNDEIVKIPTLGDVNNTAYFTDYNNNLVYLGIFENETPDIRIEYDDPWFMQVSEVTFGGLDMDKMDKLVASQSKKNCQTSYSNNTLTITMEAEGSNNMAMIPIVYSKNLKFTVDGKEVEGQPICGLFTGVRVHSGQNTIHVTFTPKGQKGGMLISLAVALLVIACSMITYLGKIKAPRIFKLVAEFVYLEAYNAVLVLLYLIPLIAAIPALIYQIVRLFK